MFLFTLLGFLLIISPLESIEFFNDHKINGFFLDSSEKLYLEIDDGSLWQLSPEAKKYFLSKGGRRYFADPANYLGSIDIRVGYFVMLMPFSTENKAYPHQLLVKARYGEESFPLYVSLAKGASQGAKLQSFNDYEMINSYGRGAKLEKGSQSAYEMRDWRIGDSILDGGVWLPSFDMREREYNDDYLFVYFNYRANEMILSSKRLFLNK